MCTGKDFCSFNENRRRAEAEAMSPYQGPSEEVMAKMFREDIGLTSGWAGNPDDIRKEIER